MAVDCDQLQDYFDRRLEQPNTFEAHLEGCEPCRAALARWSDLDRVLRAGPEVKAVWPLPVGHRWRGWAMAATLLLGLVVAAWLRRDQPPSGYVAEVSGARLLECEVWVDGRKVECVVKGNLENAKSALPAGGPGSRLDPGDGSGETAGDLAIYHRRKLPRRGARAQPQGQT